MTINLDDFICEDKELQSEVSVVPYAQFINPKCGIGIKVEQAAIAGFNPDKNWKELTNKFRDKSQEKMFVSENPRMLVLNVSALLMQEKAGKKAPVVYDPSYSKVSHKIVRYMVVWFLDENNQPLSNIPFRINVGGLAKGQLLDVWSRKFCPEYSKIFTELTGRNTGFSYQLAVYNVILKTDVFEAGDGSGGSDATGVDSYLSPNSENFTKLTISRKQTFKGQNLIEQIKTWVKTTKKWVTPKQLEQEYAEIESPVDPETGEIILPPELREALPF